MKPAYAEQWGLPETEYPDNVSHSIRAELYQRSDVDVVGSKVDTRTEAQASIRKRFDTLSILLRNLFADYDKCQRDNAGVGIEVKFQMDALMEGAYKAWL